MAYILGISIAFWIIYSLIALIAKHKLSLIISSVLGFIAGVARIIVSKDFNMLIGVALAILLIAFIIPIQVKSKAKEEWKQRKNDRK